MIYPWQSSLWSMWHQQLQSGAAPQAMIVSGVPGLGQLDLAKHMVNHLLCVTHDCCGACDGCYLTASGNHPDYYYLGLADKARDIKVDDVRSLNAWLNGSAHQGGYKAVVLDGVDVMTPSAANAFLKQLEEPPGLCCFILIDYQRRPLLPTIRSRAQCYSCDASDENQINQWLCEQYPQMPPHSYERWMGAPLILNPEAISSLLDYRKKLLQSLKMIAQKNMHPVALVKRLGDYDLPQLLFVWLNVTQDILRVKQGMRLLTDASYDQALAALASYYSVERLLVLYDRLCQVRQSVMGLNPLNHTLVLERAFMAWQSEEVYVD